MSTTAGRWAREYDRCTECGTTERRHAGGGRCETCRMRQRRATHDPVRRHTPILCRACGAPAVSKGLCAHHYQQQRTIKRAIAAGREYVPRRRPHARPDPLFSADRYVDTWRCAGCGTTIRPRHSAGLCVDCVRAAGRLAVDPWEAA